MAGGSRQRKPETFLYCPKILFPFLKFHCAVWFLSCVWLFATLWTVACQAPLSIRFSRQEHWNGLPFSIPGALPHPRIEPTSLESHYCHLVIGLLCCAVSQLCLTLCDPMDCSPPGSSIHGLLQVRVLKWVAFPFYRESSQLRERTQVSWEATLLCHFV